MLSRVANSLYWLSRYLERAENLARLVEVNRYESLENSDPNPWRPLLYTTCTEDSFNESKETDVGMFISFS
ncbi:MAG: alpha-E domain-containing protein, partial [Verrucomicrobiota bacterium]|nr:alpha-E domain-containing protein [Verrucomicrobiota bacterium]